ncbi:MAG: NRDE family protein [Planctomycetota bacterium]
MVTNRDEQHTRPDAEPPQRRRFGDRVALFPADPPSGGTWVAVNDAGLAVTLLNLKTPGLPTELPDAVSRGHVIPRLLHHARAEDAARDALALGPAATLPYRLLLVDATHTAVVRADGTTVDLDLQPRSDAPTMLTSSGLGDHLVEPPRRELFDQAPPATPDAQDAFHRHRWPDRTPVSVKMHRPDARTVSRTVVEVVRPDAGGPPRVTMAYTPVAFDGREGPTVWADLSPRTPAEATA